MPSYPFAKTVDRILEQFATRYYPDDPAMPQKLKDNRIARLLVTFPFIAGSRAPQRYAAAYLGLLINARDFPEHFKTVKGESVRDRLSTLGRLFDFCEKPYVVEKAMALLELASLVDHWNDRKKDQETKRYNPLNDPSTPRGFYKTERDRLVDIITSIRCPEIDRIITPAVIGNRFLW